MNRNFALGCALSDYDAANGIRSHFFTSFTYKKTSLHDELRVTARLLRSASYLSKVRWLKLVIFSPLFFLITNFFYVARYEKRHDIVVRFVLISYMSYL